MWIRGEAGRVLTSEVQGPVGQHAPHRRQDFVKQAALVSIRALHTSHGSVTINSGQWVLS